VLILIVDDEPLIRDALARIIDVMGHRSCWADNGHGALRLLRDEQPALMILDMLLPGLDGWGVLRQKTMDPAIRHIPVILLSALTTEAIHVQSRAIDEALAGALLILGKPIEIGVLKRAIESLASPEI
jgi:CheY-like chemotaxis protein